VLVLAPFRDKLANLSALLGESFTLLIYLLINCFLWVSAESRLGRGLGTVTKMVLFTGIGANAVISMYGMVKTWINLLRKQPALTQLGKSQVVV